MSYDERDMSGVLFRAELPKKNPKGPDYKGRALIEGREFYLAGWVRDGKRGKFLSLAVSLPKPKVPEKKAEAAP